uniref:Glycosyltransferase n=1 Tax=Linum usitatissimum TaxID=4006 RepID=I2BH54_LINUS|nr:UDP-glycosyltransferase 1 [Linum usitatissimum]
MEAKTKTQKAHVLILPYPSQGHINPLLQFAKRLASKGGGIKATIATTHYTVASITAAVAVEPISDGFDGGGFAQAGNEQAFLQSFRSNGSRTLSKLVEKYESSEFPVTCIVYDSFLPWALDVAKQYGVYGAAFFTNSAAVCGIFCRVSRGEVALEMAAKEGGLDFPGLPSLGLSDLPSFLRFPESYPTYLGMKLCQYSNLEEVDWIFCNSFQELESKEAGSVKEHWPAKLIGPMVPSSYLDSRIEGDNGYGASLWKPLNDECTKWLEAKPAESVAFISFGSMVSLTEEQTAEITAGLEESGVEFLWVVRDSELSKIPKRFRESLTSSTKGLIVSWCNQLEMLAHRATGCFVTHCGWNSTLEGLSLGVPMVAMPQWTDQVTNAKYIEDVWRVGVRAKEDRNGIAGREEIAKCLKEVMLEGDRSKEIKEAARKWRRMAVEAVSEGGDSDKEIDRFVKHLMKGRS